MKKNVLIVGAGGVAHVAAHKAAMNNELLGDICIASRTLSKCDEIIESIKRKGHIQNPANKLYSRQIDALDIPATIKLIKETSSEIVINLGQAFLNMSILEACLETGAVYIDTGDLVYSSSLARNRISDGDMTAAAEILGRYYMISGTVVHGRDIGHALGFPTANIYSPNEIIPPDGVYAVIQGGKRNFFFGNQQITPAHGPQKVADKGKQNRKDDETGIN